MVLLFARLYFNIVIFKIFKFVNLEENMILYFKFNDFIIIKIFYQSNTSFVNLIVYSISCLVEVLQVILH